MATVDPIGLPGATAENKYVKKTAAGLVEIDELAIEDFLKQRIFHKIEKSFSGDLRNAPDDNIPMPKLIFNNGSFIMPADQKSDPRFKLGGSLQEPIEAEKTFHYKLIIIKEIFKVYEGNLKSILGEDFYNQYLQGVVDALDASNVILKKMEECFNGDVKFSELNKKLDDLSIVISENMKKNQTIAEMFEVLFQPDDPAISSFLDGLFRCQDDIIGTSIDTDEKRRLFLKDKILKSGDVLAIGAVEHYDFLFSGGQRMQSLMAAPVQRVPRYPMAIKEIYGFALTEEERERAYNAVKDEIMKNKVSISGMTEKEIEESVEATIEKLRFEGKWASRPIVTGLSFNAELRRKENQKIWPYDLKTRELIKKMAIEEDNKKRKIKINESDFQVKLSDVSLVFDVDEFCQSLEASSKDGSSVFYGMSFYKEKSGEKDTLVIKNENGYHFMSVEVAHGKKSKNVNFKLFKVPNLKKPMEELRDDLAKVVTIFQDNFVSQVESKNDKKFKEPICKFQCDWDESGMVREKITEMNDSFRKRLKNVKKDLQSGVAKVTALPVTDPAVPKPAAAPDPRPSKPADSAGGGVAGSLIFRQAPSSTAAPKPDSNPLSTGLTRVTGSPKTDHSNRADAATGREQIFSRGNDFMVSAALIHHLSKMGRGQVLFADCETEKSYRDYANKGLKKMQSDRSERIEKRESTKSRLSAYRDYHEGLKISNPDANGTEKITATDGGVMIRRYNAAKKCAEIAIQPGSDRIILVALEANQYLQPLKIKIPYNNGKPVTMTELNKGDMEFLLKSLVASKVSGIPIQVDAPYLDMISKKFPEVLKHIEQINLIDKQDVQDLIAEKGSHSLTQLVDIFSGRGSEPKQTL